VILQSFIIKKLKKTSVFGRIKEHLGKSEALKIARCLVGQVAQSRLWTQTGPDGPSLGNSVGKSLGKLHDLPYQLKE